MPSKSLCVIDSIIPPASWASLEFCKLKGLPSIWLSAPSNKLLTSFLVKPLLVFSIGSATFSVFLKSSKIPLKFEDFLVICPVELGEKATKLPFLAFILLLALSDNLPLLNLSIIC